MELRCIPEALAYFVTPKAVDENSPLLQQLPHWAACSITQALEFLTPSYKGHPRVMAYILRVLESYPPERVTFFMPQLVQSLRYDDEVGYLINTLIHTIHNINPHPTHAPKKPQPFMGILYLYPFSLRVATLMALAILAKPSTSHDLGRGKSKPGIEPDRLGLQ